MAEAESAGITLYGHPVAGSIEHLPQVLQDFKAQHVILAMPSAAADALKHAADIAVRAGAHVFTVPGIDDLMNGKVAINAMRPVDIEDLLGREPVKIDSAHVQAMITGKTVLITGAGGSIGSELCRQLARFAPAQLVLFEASEFALYTIKQWFRVHKPETSIVPLAGDVKDSSRLEEVFAEWRPQLVFHAAAYKHVPLMEVGNRRPSISLVQRHLRIGYNRTARLIEQMERSGLVTPMGTNGNREVVAPAREGE